MGRQLASCLLLGALTLSLAQAEITSLNRNPRFWSSVGGHAAASTGPRATEGCDPGQGAAQRRK